MRQGSGGSILVKKDTLGRKMVHWNNLDADRGGVNNFDRLSYLDLNFQLLKNNKNGHGLARPTTSTGTTNQHGGLNNC